MGNVAWSLKKLCFVFPQLYETIGKHLTTSKTWRILRDYVQNKVENYNTVKYTGIICIPMLTRCILSILPYDSLNVTNISQCQEKKNAKRAFIVQS